MKNRFYKTIITAALFSALLTGCSSMPQDLFAEQASDTAQSLASQIIEESGDKVKEIAKETAKEAAQQAAENAQELAEQATQSAKEAAQQAIEQAGNYAENPEEALSATTASSGLLSSADELGIRLKGSKDRVYNFDYDGKTYTAIHTTDHWKIMDSYEINNEADMLIICQALIDLHPIHGKDMVSYRTADDMVYEWEVHNLAYVLVTNDEDMKAHLRDVDFNPEDQNCSFDEIYYNHTGKELDLGAILGG